MGRCGAAAGADSRRLALRRWGKARLCCVVAAAVLSGLHAGSPSTVLPCQRSLRGSLVAAPVAGRPGLARRGLVLSVPAGLALELIAPKGALAAGLGRAEITAAVTVLKDLQRRWPELEKGSSADAGDAISAVLSSNTETSFDVNIPAGSSLGVDIEGLEVTGVTDRSFGWQVGDKISQINDVEVVELDKAVKIVKEARDANQPIRVKARRLFQSPFVTLERSLRNVYQESDKPLPEAEEVIGKVSDLKNLAPLLRDGVVPMGDLRPTLDKLVQNLEAYISETGASPATSKATAKSSSASEDVGDLFR